MVLYTVDGFENYFRDMYWLLNHWTSGEMGMGYFPIYSVVVGVVLLVIRANIHKFINDFIRPRGINYSAGEIAGLCIESVCKKYNKKTYNEKQY